jgi:hypothetical protein
MKYSPFSYHVTSTACERTLWYRLSWGALVRAYEGNHRLAKEESERYRKRALNAPRRPVTHCLRQVVERHLKDFFLQVAEERASVC